MTTRLGPWRLTEALPRLRDMGAAMLEHCRRNYSVAASQAAFNRMLLGLQ
jgi:hypothetical protein